MWQSSSIRTLIIIIQMIIIDNWYKRRKLQLGYNQQEGPRSNLFAADNHNSSLDHSHHPQHYHNSECKCDYNHHQHHHCLHHHDHHYYHEQQQCFMAEATKALSWRPHLLSIFPTTEHSSIHFMPPMKGIWQDYCLLSEDFTIFSFHYLGLPEFVRRCTDTIAAAQHCGKGKRLCTCSEVALDNVNSNSWNISGMVNYGEIDANVDWGWYCDSWGGGDHGSLDEGNDVEDDKEHIDFTERLWLTMLTQGDYVLCVREDSKVSHYIINKIQQGEQTRWDIK